MIAVLEKVKGMELPPQACVLCSNNPVDELTGEQQECIFAPGVDIDWGSSVYICKSCVELIADLFGRVPEEKHNELLRLYTDMKLELQKLEEENDRLKALMVKVAEGKKAEKEVRKKVVA
jgi:cell shape-determining protein MreC